MVAILFPVLLGINLDASHHFIAVAARPPRKEKVATGEGGGGGGGPTSYPLCNHVGVQLRSEGGVPIGSDSAAKKNPKGGLKGGLKGCPNSTL